MLRFQSKMGNDVQHLRETQHAETLEVAIFLISGQYESDTRCFEDGNRTIGVEETP